MRSLFDVNVAIAFHDRRHADHQRAHAWWARAEADGWASCPLTENGFMRILSQPAYPRRISAEAAIGLLHFSFTQTDHVFWPDDVSLLDNAAIDPTNILGPNQITDIYLLALAVRHGGRLVTFDRNVNVAAVRGFKPEHLVIL